MLLRGIGRVRFVRVDGIVRIRNQMASDTRHMALPWPVLAQSREITLRRPVAVLWQRLVLMVSFARASGPRSGPRVLVKARSSLQMHVSRKTHMQNGIRGASSHQGGIRKIGERSSCQLTVGDDDDVAWRGRLRVAVASLPGWDERKRRIWKMKQRNGRA